MSAATAFFDISNFMNNIKISINDGNSSVNLRTDTVVIQNTHILVNSKYNQREHFRYRSSQVDII